MQGEEWTCLSLLGPYIGSSSFFLNLQSLAQWLGLAALMALCCCEVDSMRLKLSHRRSHYFQVGALSPLCDVCPVCWSLSQNYHVPT